MDIERSHDYILVLIVDPKSECFDVSMYKQTSDYGWTFGKCSGSKKWLGSGTYTDKCCTSKGSYILSCSTKSHVQRDWSNSILMMLGHQFCDDFVGHMAFIRLNISGDQKYQCMFACLQILSKFFCSHNYLPILYFST